MTEGIEKLENGTTCVRVERRVRFVSSTVDEIYSGHSLVGSIVAFPRLQQDVVESDPN